MMEFGKLMDVIVARGISVKFGDFTAVDDICLSVKEGEIFGFLGPNGAGKTTTIKVLTTLMKPTSGKIWIGGYAIPEDADKAKHLIGISQQHISLDKDISVRENLRYHAMLQDIPKKEAIKRIDELSRMMGLDDYLDKIVFNLSGGWKRRTAIMCAILHNPKILFLDEPTAGLDTQSRHMLWELIRRLKVDGTTIFHTTHYIEEAEALCDRVAIINHGKIIVIGSPKELCKKIGIITVEAIASDGFRSFKYFQTREEAHEYADFIGRDITLIRKTNLEDVFLELTGRETSIFVEPEARI